MEIITYQNKYQQQIISLILHIQNDEAKINLPLEEQPDLLNIPAYYHQNGGAFLLAVDHDRVIGTLAFMNYGNGNAVLKKFFVHSGWRGKKVGLALYESILDILKRNHFHQVLLDTPSVARASHRFYEKAGFQKISPHHLPFPYHFPDRNSYLYLLKL